MKECLILAFDNIYVCFEYGNSLVMPLSGYTHAALLDPWRLLPYLR